MKEEERLSGQMDDEPAAPQFHKDRFIKSAEPDSAEMADRRDRFTAGGESDSEPVSPADEFVSDEAFRKAMEKILTEEIGNNLPPLYVQVRSLVSALAEGTTLLKPLQHYVSELKVYIRKQRKVFGSIKTDDDRDFEAIKSKMLEGIELVSDVVKSVERSANIPGGPDLRRADEMLNGALECFFAARDILGLKASL